jgi:hypothetical protein
MKPELRIGTDEAGYGPTLGPLVVSAVALRGRDLREEGSPIRLPRSGLRLTDSKVVHRGGLVPLETAALAILHQDPAGAPRSLASILAIPGPILDRHPWYGAMALDLPVAAASDQVLRAAEELCQELERRGLRVAAVRIACRLEGDLREAFVRQNKADCEWECILALWDALLAEEGAPTRIRCDRLGGRRRYGGLLAGWRPFAALETVEEAAGTSAYRLGGTAASVEVRFDVGGELRWPEVAMASIVAKYVRELCMHLLNRHLQAIVPGLAATAGYPSDARRFLADLARNPAGAPLAARLLRGR